MPDIAGGQGLLPSVVTDVVTQSRGVSIPGGSRVAAMIGEGSTDQTVISQATGGGKDGLDPTFTTTSGSDGRHFILSNTRLISNRTTIFKNGVPLVGLEGTIGIIASGQTFPSQYDYMLDITTGRLILQSAHLVDQGGTFYVPLSTNVGLGTLNSLTLIDPNAQPEIWTVRCSSVQRNAMNQPVPGTATFTAIGSVSGQKIDANGNPIVWIANNQVVSNGIISFAIQETQSMSVTVSPFVQGDAFTIKVASGVLVRSDSLTANYIPSTFLNAPVLTQGMGDVVSRHGLPSLTNNLSLGAQLAYSNASPTLITCQAAPPLPRRTSYVLEESVESSSNPDDFIFPLPLGVVPDFNSNIHFFVTNPLTNVETQILPNKFTYYLLGTAGQPTVNQFIFDNTPAPGGNSYAYTVIQSLGVVATGEDGYIGRNTAFTNQGVFSSSIVFDSTYVGKTLKIIDALNTANISTYTINAVNNGQLFVTHATFTDFTTENPTTFQLINPLTGLPVANGSGVDGTLVALLSTATATLTSSAVNFATVPNLFTLRLQINGSVHGNNGLYDIIGFNSGTNTLTIKKAVVTESGMRYEVLDTNAVTNYIVVNHNVAPSGNKLRVTIVNSKDATFYDAGWINALASLEIVECDILVPLPRQTISIIFQNALAHCKSMSNIRNKKERVLFIGAIQGLVPDNLTGAKPAAVEDIGILEGIQGETITDILAGNVEDLADYSVPNAFGSTFRAVYFYPDQIVVQAGTDNVLIDGFYLAAAAAGFESADVLIQNPLTYKVLSGFTILANKTFSNATLEQLAAAGVTTVQPVAGGGKVIWGLTTSQSGFIEEQEISIVFIRDRVAKTLRAGFQGFIGQPQTLDTGAILNTRAVILLNSLISQGIITNFKDLSVTQDSLDPTQWNITVRVQPTYPVNFIYIKVSLGQL